VKQPVSQYPSAGELDGRAASQSLVLRMGDDPEPVDMGETPGILSLLSASLQLRPVSNGPATAMCRFMRLDLAKRLIAFDVEIPSNLV
jgi:hypothetical protein